MATKNEITTILTVEAGHSIRPVARGRYDYSNLSDFECSCGQIFVASQMTRRFDPLIQAPTLPQVHLAKETADALGVTGGFQELAPVGILAAQAFGTVLYLVTGQLAQKKGIADSGPWITQAAEALSDADVARIGAVIAWAP